jgi:hypothetical protein
LATGLVTVLLFFTSFGGFGSSAPCVCKKVCPCCAKTQQDHRPTAAVFGMSTQVESFVGILKSLPAMPSAKAIRSQRLSPSETEPCGQNVTEAALRSEVRFRADDSPPVLLVAIHTAPSKLIRFSRMRGKSLISTAIDDPLSVILRI